MNQNNSSASLGHYSEGQQLVNTQAVIHGGAVSDAAGIDALTEEKPFRGRGFDKHVNCNKRHSCNKHEWILLMSRHF